MKLSIFILVLGAFIVGMQIGVVAYASMTMVPEYTIIPLECKEEPKRYI